MLVVPSILNQSVLFSFFILENIIAKLAGLDFELRALSTIFYMYNKYLSVLNMPSRNKASGYLTQPFARNLFFTYFSSFVKEIFSLEFIIVDTERRQRAVEQETQEEDEVSKLSDLSKPANSKDLLCGQSDWPLVCAI